MAKDRVITIDGKVIFVPSESINLGQKNLLEVTMSGASLSHSVVAPSGSTSSYWYFKASGHTVKVYYDNPSGSAIEPTQSGIPHTSDDYSNRNFTGSSIRVDLGDEDTGSNFVYRTAETLNKNPRVSRHFEFSYVTQSNKQGGYLYIKSRRATAPLPEAQNIYVSNITGFDYTIKSSGSAATSSIGQISGSAKALLTIDDKGLDTTVPNSSSHINLQNGFYGIVNTHALTGSNVSLHGGAGFDYGQPIPNSPYIKSNGGFDFVLDSGGQYTNTQFRIFRDKGLAGVPGSTELFKIDENGNLTTLGSIDGGTY